MDITAQQLEKLKHIAIAEFKMAADYGAPKPAGLAIILRSQIIFTGLNVPTAAGHDMAEQCLSQPQALIDATTEREHIPPCLEIVGICISQIFNPDKPVEPQVDEVVKRKLAASPLIGDGQIIHVVHPYRDETRSFKL